MDVTYHLGLSLDFSDNCSKCCPFSSDSSGKGPVSRDRKRETLLDCVMYKNRIIIITMVEPKTRLRHVNCIL